MTLAPETRSEFVRLYNAYRNAAQKVTALLPEVGLGPGVNHTIYTEELVRQVVEAEKRKEQAREALNAFTSEHELPRWK